MLQAGIYHTLKVNRVSEFGLYLIDDQENEVLLPNRYVSLQDKVGDMLDVFVYHDSEDRIVASTEHPYGTVGQVAFLEVVDKTIHGAFMDWGLEAKDIFLPNRNQVGGCLVGEKYVVYIYRDNITGRAVATGRFNTIINNTELSVKLKDKVEIMVAFDQPIGYRVVINNRHWGMLYRNQIFAPVQVGDRLTAYIRKIADDNRIDVSLQQEGYDEVKSSADRIVELINFGGGELPLGDNSSPEEVYRITRMSKKVFKRSLGYLLKRGDIEKTERGVKLVKKVPSGTRN